MCSKIALGIVAVGAMVASATVVDIVLGVVDIVVILAVMIIVVAEGYWVLRLTVATSSSSYRLVLMVLWVLSVMLLLWRWLLI